MSMSDTAQAFDTLRQALQDDDSFAHAWHCNIAMSFYDSMPEESFWFPDKCKHHAMANEGATRFMKQCFDIETSNDMLEVK